MHILFWSIFCQNCYSMSLRALRSGCCLFRLFYPIQPMMQAINISDGQGCTFFVAIVNFKNLGICRKFLNHARIAAIFIGYISKISKKSKISDIFDIFKNIMIFSIPGHNDGVRGVISNKWLLVFTDTSAPVGLRVRASDGVKAKVSAAEFRSARYSTENRIWFSQHALKIAPTIVVQRFSYQRF